LRDEGRRRYADLRDRPRLANRCRVPRWCGVLDGAAPHRHVHQRQVERAHFCGRATPSRTARPCRAAWPRAARLPRRSVLAGRGADLFESTAAENIGAMILGVGVYAIAVSAGWPHPSAWIFFPLVVRAFGLLSTIVAIFFVRGREDENPMNMLNRGYWVTTI